jgi:hypothetical protein
VLSQRGGWIREETLLLMHACIQAQRVSRSSRLEWRPHVSSTVDALRQLPRVAARLSYAWCGAKGARTCAKPPCALTHDAPNDQHERPEPLTSPCEELAGAQQLCGSAHPLASLQCQPSPPPLPLFPIPCTHTFGQGDLSIAPHPRPLCRRGWPALQVGGIASRYKLEEQR